MLLVRSSIASYFGSSFKTSQCIYGRDICKKYILQAGKSTIKFPVAKYLILTLDMSSGILIVCVGCTIKYP